MIKEQIASFGVVAQPSDDPICPREEEGGAFLPLLGKSLLLRHFQAAGEEEGRKKLSYPKKKREVSPLHRNLVEKHTYSGRNKGGGRTDFNTTYNLIRKVPTSL